MAKATSAETLEFGVGGLPLVRDQGLNTNTTTNLSGTQVDTSGNITGAGTLSNVAGTATFNTVAATTMTVSSTLTPTGGIAQAGSVNSTVFHSGGVGFPATTAATQAQIVTTDTYFCEVFIPATTVLTGISILNGHTTSGSQNMFVGLANAGGTIVASSNTTTAQATADAYQQIPFSATYTAVGPAKYFIAVQGSATTGYIATHTIGNFGAALKTSETYGAFVTTASYKTTTFTTAQGPVADTY